jgi:hypothetical protein
MVPAPTNRMVLLMVLIIPLMVLVILLLVIPLMVLMVIPLMVIPLMVLMVPTKQNRTSDQMIRMVLVSLIKLTKLINNKLWC